MTSFAAGHFPQINTIDFDFVFAAASFQDNMTIYFFLIISFTLYILAMIWALYNDRKDSKAVSSPLVCQHLRPSHLAIGLSTHRYAPTS